MEEQRKPLTIAQRQKKARQMKRLAPRLARFRKIKAKRKADKDTLMKRAQKAARNVIRKKVSGGRGENYSALSPSEKVTIDKLVAKKSAVIQRMAKKLLPKIRKAEMERLKQARGSKNEEFDINEAFDMAIMIEKKNEDDEAPKKTKQDPDVKDIPGTQPKKYYKGLSDKEKESRAKQFAKGGDKPDDSPSSYKPAPGDDDAKTKPSKHTKKYKQMFGEGAVEDTRERHKREKEAMKRDHDREMDQARLQDTREKNQQTESFEINESAKAGLQKKADKSGVPYSILKKVYDRGMAAWKTGHRPGATQQQWAYARVNSFLTGGGARKSDNDLWQKAKSAKKSKKESVELGEAKKISPMPDRVVKGDYYFKDDNMTNNRARATEFQKKYGGELRANRADIRVYFVRNPDKIDAMIASYDPKNEDKGPCWDGYKQVGMKKGKDGKPVPNCVQEAVSPAQQAAIAISKKERGEKPKKESANLIPMVEVEMECPPATKDVKLNTKNRDATIKNFNYGPLNVDEPGDYWKDIAKYWKTTEEAAKKSKCGNCVAFDVSPRMKECMPGETSDEDGVLGYCWMHHFKCHSARACHTWAKGGPIKDDKKSYDWQQRAFGKKEKAKNLKAMLGMPKARPTTQFGEENKLDEVTKPTTAQIRMAKRLKKAGVGKNDDFYLSMMDPETRKKYEPSKRPPPMKVKPPKGKTFNWLRREEAELEEMPRWLLEPLSKVTRRKGYEAAKKVLADVLARKKKEAGRKGLQHSIEYYAQQIAKQFDGVDARVLADMITEQPEKMDAPEIGTDKIKKRFSDMTPGQVDESYVFAQNEIKIQGAFEHHPTTDFQEDYLGWVTEDTLEEAEYQGRKVKLRDPFRTPKGPKKFSVYVKNPKTDNVIKVNFGDPDMEIKRDDPESRKNFRARHNCDDKTDETTAGYWSCRMWSKGQTVSDLD